MRQTKRLLMEAILVLAVSITACKKEISLPDPGNHTGDETANPDSSYKLKIKAAITIGDILYDSIPAGLQIISWDKNNVAHQRQIDLAAGANEISLDAAATKFQLKLNKWGITDELTFAKSQMKEGSLIILGGTKAAKKLRLEETYFSTAGSYQTESKTVYNYNTAGNLTLIEYFQGGSKPDTLLLYQTDAFVYSGNRLERINRFNETGLQIGFTDFKYSPEGKINTVNNKIHDRGTAAFIEYVDAGKDSNIDIDYLFSNGTSMVYKMTIQDGNNVEDTVRSSLGPSEKGVYGYDLNINPHAHMNWPDAFLSNLSKNNLVKQQKSYIGNFPSWEPYKFEYSYDAEGYPIELIKSYRSYQTAEHLYKIKTVYTY